MTDGLHKPFEDNVDITKRVVVICRPTGSRWKPGVERSAAKRTTLIDKEKRKN
jgi:hypothetical protein